MQKPRVTHTDDYTIIESEITGRKLFVNRSDDRFLILPNFSADRLEAAFVAFARHYKSQPPATPPLRPYLFGFASCENIGDFRLRIEQLVTYGKAMEGNQNSGRITDLLMALWRHDLIAMPGLTASKYFGRLYRVREFYGDVDDKTMKSMIDDLYEASEFQDSTTEQHMRLVITLMSSIGGAKTIGDLTPQAINGRLIKQKLGKSTARVIERIIKKNYGDTSQALHYQDYGPFGRHGVKHDKTFMWIVEERPDLEEWREAAESWLAQLGRNVAQAMAALTSLFALLADMYHKAVSIEEWLRDGSLVPAGELSDRYAGPVRLFFDWLILTRFTSDDGSGRPEVDAGIVNPIGPRGPMRLNYESVYDAMPTRFVRRLRELIEDNDFEFPKRAFDRRTDYIRRFNKERQIWETIWCPIRAYIILLKLEIPERTYQIRVCNSGEADLERYYPDTDTWKVNTHPLAGKGVHGKPMGVAIKIYDRHQNKDSVGLYFNTNKTADIYKHADDRGHVVPWNNQRVLRIVDQARTWQEDYNPVSELTNWSDLSERAITMRLSDKQRMEMGAETFLFRDPFGRRPERPIEHTRLTQFWNEMCAELERRLEAEGELGPDGLPFKLVFRDSKGRVSGTYFPLHALRTTLITAWAENGVPIDILMKVAGHATALMAAYYQKRSISHISEILNDATTAVLEKEQQNWERFLKDVQADALHQYVAFNDTIGITAFAQASPTSRVRVGYGLCPVGCKRCENGGPPNEGKSAVNGPVPGPYKQNCIRCRFFITGVPFTLRLIEKFEWVEFNFKEASRLYAEAELAFEKADYERKKSVASGVPFTEMHRYEVLSAILDQRTREVDEWALTWHAFYNRIQDCLKLRETHKDDKRYALIVPASLSEWDFSLEFDENGTREIELLDRVCQQATFYGSQDVTLPNLKRMRRFDAFIKKQGHRPIFLEMSESEGLHLGNEFGRFMFSTFGVDRANDLLSGRTTLKAMGIDDEKRVFSKLGELAGIAGQKPERPVIEHRISS
ncbi:VPA1269 family protein [Rhizobium leguminosarum]